MIFPLNKKIVLLNNTATGFLANYVEHTEIPCGNHPGSFGFVRKYHIHEGIDLYAQEKDPVYAIEDGVIVDIFPFTGPQLNNPWWNDTWSVMVKGQNQTLNYGEILPNPQLKKGDFIQEGTLLGNILTVLVKNKGRPMNMLHLEMFENGLGEIVEWKDPTQKPQGLLDPTNFVINLALNNKLLAESELEKHPNFQKNSKLKI